MTTTAANKGGLLGATYTDFGLTGASGFEYHITALQLCNIGTGSTLTVDAVMDYGGGSGNSMFEMLRAAPVSYGDPVRLNAGVPVVLSGQTLRLRGSTANLVAANISYQKITV